MTTGRNANVPPPLRGASLIRFALDAVVVLLHSEPHGLDQDTFIRNYFPNDVFTPVLSDHWWGEFKRAAKYSNRQFDNEEDGWAMIRARPGSQRGQYLYHVIAIRDGERVDIRQDPASLERLEDFTNRRWLTQTRSRMRVKAAEGLAYIETARRTGNARLEAEGQAILNEIVTLSPRLAAINFDSGIVNTDLSELARSRNPTIQRLLGPRISRAQQSAERLERDINDLAEQVLQLQQIYTQGSQRQLP